MRILAIVAILALLLTATSVVAQEDGKAEYRFESPAFVRLLLETTREGQQAADTRAQIDAFGDADGVVTQAEVDQAESAFLNLTRQFGNGRDDTNLTVDGKPRTNFTFDQIEIRDAVGPASSDAPLQFRIIAAIEFPVAAGDRHTVRILANASQSDSPANATLIAPPGYRIDSTRGLPSAATVSSDKTQIAFGGPLASPGEMVIVFAKPGGLFGMGAAGGILLIVLAVAVVAGLAFFILRARRHP